MTYLISHIVVCLAFALWLGLLLGWLLWGYTARQRGKEVQTLRERMADMNFMSAARMAMAPEPRMAMNDAPGALPNVFSGAELTERPAVRRAFFEDDTEQPSTKSLSEPARQPILGPPPIAPDLEAEVRESKIQHLQRQVLELEGFRTRLPLLQADLSDAITGRKAAEARFLEANNDFELRSSSLLAQIRDFEGAAAEWDRSRGELEREKLSQQKELATVKATLRDLQNSQMPQAVDAAPAPPAASAAELADLRERYQKAVHEREIAAKELEFWKQHGNGQSGEATRLAELEEAVRSRDMQLSEQAARVESLLWRVAELEPFAAEAPHKEENLRRQESEIAGHMAMHSENAERIRSLLSRVEDLQSSTVPSDELQRIVGEHQTAVQELQADHQQRLAELQQSIAIKDDEIAEHVSVRHDQISQLDAMQSRLSELDVTAQQLKQSLIERNGEIGALLAAHSQTQMEREAARQEVEAVRNDASAWRQQISELEQALAVQSAEVQRFKDLNTDRESQLTFFQERLLELEPLAARTPEIEKQLVEHEHESRETLKALEQQHHTELTRLKVNSAQRIRRFRQSINSFKI